MRSPLGRGVTGLLVVVACCAAGLRAAPARATVGEFLPSTPLSISTLAPGQLGTWAVLGFPYLSVGGLYGVAPGFDVGVQARAAWQQVQRVNVQARWRFASFENGALGVRAVVGTWTGRPTTPLWLDFTGEQDLTAQLGLAYTTGTPGGTLLTFEGSVLGIGNTLPPGSPLGGLPPPIAFGANLQLRVAAEVPHSSGFRLTFETGLDVHTSGFDNALAVPLFGVGVGYVLPQ